MLSWQTLVERTWSLENAHCKHKCSDTEEPPRSAGCSNEYCICVRSKRRTEVVVKGVTENQGVFARQERKVNF